MTISVCVRQCLLEGEIVGLRSGGRVYQEDSTSSASQGCKAGICLTCSRNREKDHELECGEAMKEHQE